MVRTIRSPKLQKHHHQLLALKIVLSLLLVGALLALPVFLSRAKFLTIQTISVSGNSVVQSSEIESVVRDELQGNYLHLFSKANIALYPKSKIKTAISEKFSRIQSFEVRSTSLTSISIIITERKPESLWCKDMQGETGCYFIDSKGLVFDEAPKFSPDVYFVYTGGIQGEPIGARYGTEESFAKLKLVVAGVRDLNLEPVAVDSISDNSYAIHLKRGGVIYFSLHDDSEKIISNLESVLSDPTISVFQNGVLTVSSLDLRYGNKVILKKRGE